MAKAEPPGLKRREHPAACWAESSPPGSRGWSERLGLVLLVWVAVGCGEKKPPTPVGPGRVAVDAGVQPHDAAGPAGPDEAECAALVAHVLDLGMAKFRDDARASGKPIPTEEQLSAIRVDLTRELTEGCRDLDPQTYQCAMAATDVAGYLACETASTNP